MNNDTQKIFYKKFFQNQSISNLCFLVKHYTIKIDIIRKCLLPNSKTQKLYN